MSLLARWKLDETSGTTVAATVGSNGTKVGGDIVGVGAGNGPGGSLDDAGFVYDGVDDWVDVGLIKSGADNFQVLTTSTFACWFKREIDTVNRAFIGMYEGFGATDSAWVLTNRDGSSGPGHLGWRVRKGSTTYRFDGNAGTNMGYADNAWHHIAVTLPSRKVFVDGVDITSSFTFSGSVDQALTNTDRTWYLGAQWSGGSTITSPFAGSLADFRFYDSDESANVASIIDDARPTCSVSISGTPNVGQLFTATPLTNDSTATFEYQWYRADNNSGLNEAPISGATSSTYTTQAADETKVIRCRSAATNTGGALLKSSYVYSDYSAEITTSGGMDATAGVAAASGSSPAPTLTTAPTQLTSGTALAEGAAPAPTLATAPTVIVAGAALAEGQALAPTVVTAGPLVAAGAGLAQASAAAPALQTGAASTPAGAGISEAGAYAPTIQTAPTVIIAGAALAQATAATPTLDSGGVVVTGGVALGQASATAPGLATAPPVLSAGAGLSEAGAVAPAIQTGPTVIVAGVGVAQASAISVIADSGGPLIAAGVAGVQVIAAAPQIEIAGGVVAAGAGLASAAAVSPSIATAPPVVVAGVAQANSAVAPLTISVGLAFAAGVASAQGSAVAHRMSGGGRVIAPPERMHVVRPAARMHTVRRERRLVFVR